MDCWEAHSHSCRHAALPAELPLLVLLLLDPVLRALHDQNYQLLQCWLQGMRAQIARPNVQPQRVLRLPDHELSMGLTMHEG